MALNRPPAYKDLPGGGMVQVNIAQYCLVSGFSRHVGLKRVCHSIPLSRVRMAVTGLSYLNGIDPSWTLIMMQVQGDPTSLLEGPMRAAVLRAMQLAGERQWALVSVCLHTLAVTRR